MFAARAAKVAEFVCVRLVRWCSEPSARAVGSIYVIRAGYGWMDGGWMDACVRASAVYSEEEEEEVADRRRAVGH